MIEYYYLSYQFRAVNRFSNPGRGRGYFSFCSLFWTPKFQKLVDKSEDKKVYIKRTKEHLSATPNNRLGDLPHGSKGFRFGYSQRKCKKTECFQCTLLQYAFGTYLPAPLGLGQLYIGDAAINLGMVMLDLMSGFFFIKVPFCLKQWYPIPRL